MTDQDDQPVWIILGTVRHSEDDNGTEMQILIAAKDEDTAIADSLHALSEAGYLEADYDEIGQLEGEPQEEPFRTAWRDAVAGEVAYIAVADEEEGSDSATDGGGKPNPFAALKDWKAGEGGS